MYLAASSSILGISPCQSLSPSRHQGCLVCSIPNHGIFMARVARIASVHQDSTWEWDSAMGRYTMTMSCICTYICVYIYIYMQKTRVCVCIDWLCLWVNHCNTYLGVSINQQMTIYEQNIALHPWICLYKDQKHHHHEVHLCNKDNWGIGAIRWVHKLR